MPTAATTTRTTTEIAQGIADASEHMERGEVVAEVLREMRAMSPAKALHFGLSLSCCLAPELLEAVDAALEDVR